VEPGCAVKEAVQRGDVSPERYASYLKLRDEIEGASFG
jgi:ribosome biogenesis GTPase